MILAALALIAQDVPVPATPQPGEDEGIVVTAQFGRTTMLFDRGADGKLRNCRIMVSSGSQKRDTDACQATPVCYAGTADEVTDCVEMTVLARAEGVGVPKSEIASESTGTHTFSLPKLAQPGAPVLSPGQAGPIGSASESRDTERQRVKLPPLPKEPTSGPVIRFGSGPVAEDRP